LRLLPMRLRVLPVLLALPLLAVPAAMLVFVCLSERRGVDGPQATEPADRVTGAAAPDGPPGVSDSLPRPAPDRPKSTGGRPPREPAREKRSERYPPAPPVDARFAVEATGRVLDPDGAPLEGAAVLALLQRSAMDVVRASAGGQATSRFSLAAETHTDVRGRFALAGLDPGQTRRHSS
jgi:hypothetical protein